MRDGRRRRPSRCRIFGAWFFDNELALYLASPFTSALYRVGSLGDAGPCDVGVDAGHELLHVERCRSLESNAIRPLARRGADRRLDRRREGFSLQGSLPAHGPRHSVAGPREPRGERPAQRGVRLREGQDLLDTRTGERIALAREALLASARARWARLRSAGVAARRGREPFRSALEASSAIRDSIALNPVTEGSLLPRIFAGKDGRRPPA